MAIINTVTQNIESIIRTELSPETVAIKTGTDKMYYRDRQEFFEIYSFDQKNKIYKLKNMERAIDYAKRHNFILKN